MRPSVDSLIRENDRLRDELEELRARAQDAEDALEAIRTGEAESLIVEGPNGPRIFSLEGADHAYRLLVETMNEGAATLSTKGTILYCNLAFAEMLEVPLEKLMGSDVARFLKGPSMLAFDELTRRAEGAGSSRGEVQLLGEKGVAVPALVSLSAIRDDANRHHLSLIASDLRGQRRYEESLAAEKLRVRFAEAQRVHAEEMAAVSRQERDAFKRAEGSEALFRQLVDNLPELAWHTRSDGYVEFYNRSWYQYTGTTFEQMQGWGWKAVHRPDMLDAVVKRWQRSLDTGQPFEMQFPILGRDGVFRWFLARIAPLHDASGNVVRWIGIGTNVDEQKRAFEEARSARDRAEEATRLKDEFLATLSHELRTPLNAILGWSRLLQSGSVPREKVTQGLDSIVRNAFAQNQLIEDLLDVSRIISGKMRLNVEMVELAQVVANAIDVVQSAADAKGVRIQSVLDPDAGIIAGDPTRLQQVAWNLLTNAVKFTPKEGRVHVMLRREGSVVELTVADTGAGIAAEFLPYVFDRFRQQDGTITRRAGGLGLGLAIVKNLVELHGGRVDVRSEGENKGATFTLRIPVAPVRSTPAFQSQRGASLPPDPLASVQVDCPPEVEGLKVLVLDDETDARELIRTVLGHCNAVVASVASVSEALESVGPFKPDVIISDIGMPDEDGYSFIRKLRGRSREEGGRTPAIALTAYARPEDRTRALSAGFQSHAAKPVDPQELLLMVANLAGRYS